jgi:hypothetical protein
MTKIDKKAITSADLRISLESFKPVVEDSDRRKIQIFIKNTRDLNTLNNFSPNQSKPPNKSINKTTISLDKRMFQKSIDYTKKDYVVYDLNKYPIKSIKAKATKKVKIKKIELSKISEFDKELTERLLLQKNSPKIGKLIKINPNEDQINIPPEEDFRMMVSISSPRFKSLGATRFGSPKKDSYGENLERKSKKNNTVNNNLKQNANLNIKLCEDQ